MVTLTLSLTLLEHEVLKSVLARFFNHIGYSGEENKAKKYDDGIMLSLPIADYHALLSIITQVQENTKEINNGMVAK